MVWVLDIYDKHNNRVKMNGNAATNNSTVIMIVSFWNDILSSSTAMLLDFAAHTSSCQSASASNSDLYAALQKRKQQLRTSCAAMQHLTGCSVVLESCRQLVYSRLNWFPALRSNAKQ